MLTSKPKWLISGILLTLAAVTAPRAEAIRVNFSYDVEFASVLAESVFLLAPGDTVFGGAQVRVADIEPAGESTAFIASGGGSGSFGALVGRIPFSANDDLFGGPEIEFVDGVPRAMFADLLVSVFTSGRGTEGYILSLGTDPNDIPDFILFTEAGDPIAFGALENISLVPLPPAVLLFATALLGLVGLRRRRA